jgi:hypothetical protein
MNSVNDDKTGMAMAASGPRHLLRRGIQAAGLAMGALLLAHGTGFAAGTTPVAVTGGIGAQAAATAGDLSSGFGFMLEFASYSIAGIAAAYAAYTFWQHHKNPNGQHKMSYAFASLLAAGFMAGLPSMVGKSAETMTGGAATVTGTTQQLTYTNGNGGG